MRLQNLSQQARRLRSPSSAWCSETPEKPRLRWPRIVSECAASQGELETAPNGLLTAAGRHPSSSCRLVWTMAMILARPPSRTTEARRRRWFRIPRHPNALQSLRHASPQDLHATKWNTVKKLFRKISILALTLRDPEPQTRPTSFLVSARIELHVLSEEGLLVLQGDAEAVVCHTYSNNIID